MFVLRYCVTSKIIYRLFKQQLYKILYYLKFNNNGILKVKKYNSPISLGMLNFRVLPFTGRHTLMNLVARNNMNKEIRVNHSPAGFVLCYWVLFYLTNDIIRRFYVIFVSIDKNMCTVMTIRVAGTFLLYFRVYGKIFFT